MATQNLVILGSTGSIGESTLDVVARHPDRYQVYALTANRSAEKLLEQCLEYSPKYAVLRCEEAARDLQGMLVKSGSATEVLSGEAGLITVAASENTDTVMAAIVGAAGLPPTLAAAQHGKTCFAG